MTLFYSCSPLSLPDPESIQFSLLHCPLSESLLHIIPKCIPISDLVEVRTIVLMHLPLFCCIPQAMAHNYSYSCNMLQRLYEQTNRPILFRELPQKLSNPESHCV